MRFRSTALGETRRDTVIPNRAFATLFGMAKTRITLSWEILLCLSTALYCVAVTSRFLLLNSSRFCVNRPQALSRIRPFARRALITALPPRVFMRARKPWVRFRFTSLGWNVRFINLPHRPKKATHINGYKLFLSMQFKVCFTH